MPIQYASGAHQPDEVLRYSMEFTPGTAIDASDSLTGDPTVKVYRLPDLLDVTEDVAGPPAVSGLLVADSDTMSDNVIYATIHNVVDGTGYKITFRSATTNGETVEEDLVIYGKSY